MFAQVLIAAGAGLLLLAGCGGPLRKPLKGNIVGNKREVLAVTFQPTGETEGPACTATVTDNAYEFTSENGPLVGTYDVVVTLADQATAGFAGTATPPDKHLRGVGKKNAAPPPPPPPRVVPVTVPDKPPFELDIQLP